MVKGGGAAGRVLMAVLCVAAAAALVAARPWLAGAGPSAALRPDDVVRLHVVAHSDGEFDQDVKRQVRDRVLAVLSESGAAGGFASPDQALAALRDQAPRLEAEARRVLAAAGAGYGVRVEVGYHRYGERRYGDLVLPAGTYASVRVILGSGRGANWWCVLYPILCSIEPPPAAWVAAGWPVDGGGEALIPLAAPAAQGGLIHAAPPPLEMRVALLEWARRTPALAGAVRRLEVLLGRAQPQARPEPLPEAP